MTKNDFALIDSEQFITMPWRNGMGTTIELLKQVEPGDERFSYRLSMATVNKDGPFSNFGGYDRTLVLLEGAGITLHYGDADDGSTDNRSTGGDRELRDSAGFRSSDILERPLQMASFDGGAATSATLHDGPITDFNIMVRSDMYRAQTICGTDARVVTLPVTPESTPVCLAVYAIDDGLQILLEDNNTLQIPAGSLLQNVHRLRNSVSLSGAAFIAVQVFRV